jgi:2-polyprenyl-3-methyl-5-hydroxy-6-metoxy-1,4-benzoquinol methylase
MDYIQVYSELPPQEQRQLQYKRQYKAENPGWDDSMVLAVNALHPLLHQQATAIDLGCGHGNYILDELREQFATIIGIDVDATVASKNSTITELRITNGHTLPVENETADVVTALWVLEHLKDPAETFAEIWRTLKPGGYFAFTTPNANALIVLARRILPYAFAKRLVQRLYGRPVADVFPVFYQANTLTNLAQLLPSEQWNTCLITENADPSYTSFNTFTYKLSTFLARTWPYRHAPHIIGIYQKKA